MIYRQTQKHTYTQTQTDTQGRKDRWTDRERETHMNTHRHIQTRSPGKVPLQNPMTGSRLNIGTVIVGNQTHRPSTDNTVNIRIML